MSFRRVSKAMIRSIPNKAPKGQKQFLQILKDLEKQKYISTKQVIIRINLFIQIFRRKESVVQDFSNQPKQDDLLLG